MKRTLYNDGVEVDQSDLANTETTKIDEILATRLALGHFGVIEGLTVLVLGNFVIISPGKAMTKTGELVVVTTPTRINGAAVDFNVSSFVGLRFNEVASNPKPHEVDPTTFNTRIDTNPIGEFFIAADSSSGARTAAFNNALAAQNQDGTFLLLGEVTGTGTQVKVVKQRPLPRTKGGFAPNLGTEPTPEQLLALGQIYRIDSLEQFAFESAEDHMHRSLIGSGIPNPKNPHGITPEDIGVADQGQIHQRKFHANGIIGLDPSTTDFAPTAGTFAFEVNNAPSRSVTVQEIAATDTVHINGVEFTNAAFGEPSDIDFSALAAGLYYIVAFYDPADGAIKVQAKLKTTFDSSNAQTNGGRKAWINAALHVDGAKRYLAIGLVRWDGANNFLDISTAGVITIPAANGDLIYNDATNGFTVPSNTPRVDLRRFGSITTEQTQKRTIRLDRLTVPVISNATFVAHTSLKVALGNDDTILKHLTDFQSLTVFGHRGSAARAFLGLEHPAARDDLSTADFFRYGFQTNVNAYKQRVLTYSLIKFSNLGDLITSNPTTRIMADAQADNAIANANSPIYPMLRNGYFTNFVARVGKTRNAGNNVIVQIFIWLAGAGQTPQNPITITIPGAGGNPPVTVVAGGATPFTTPVITGVTPSNPLLIACSVTDGLNSGARNLTVTCEFHPEP